MTTFGFIEGFMPLQFLIELAGMLFILSSASWFLARAGWIVGRLTKAVIIFSVVFVWLTYRIYPPVPWSVRVTYLGVTLLAILLWASSSEAYWQEVRGPIIKLLDAETASMKIIRVIIFALIPSLAASLTWNALTKLPDEPFELRTVGPAPPAAFQLHGQEIVLQTTQNPYRVNRQGMYDPHYLAQRVRDDRTGRSWEIGVESDAWHSGGDRFLQAVKEGGLIYFQECVFCHGANLNGRGIFTPAFSKPFPTNFTDPGTIAQRQESYIFWRTATGGMNLPNEGFPWISTMPKMEEHLSTDDIWKVVLFTYWHTGWVPRTWD
jgi:hypothetical protein